MSGQYFKLARLRFRLAAVSPIELPSGYKGSTFHGAFGQALKSLSPHFYDQLFDPVLYCGESRNQLPKPFVLIPPLGECSRFSPGDEFQFELVLFGMAVNHLATCIAAFDHLGKHLGLGLNKGRFAIRAIEAIRPSGEASRILDERGRIACVPLCEASEFSVTPTAAPAIRIDLNTRLRLTHDNRKITTAPSFQLFFARLLGRIKNLSDLYEEREIISSAEKHELIAASKQVSVAEDNLIWSDWPRYSGRQHDWMQFGGLLGSIVYESNLDPFLPWLKLGEWTHIGGKTSFGLGKYHTEILQ